MTIRWGILGCGDVCEVKSGPGFQKARGSELVAVMRRNGALAEDYARRHGVPRWYDDADRLIADPEVDAVYIATPPGSHADYASRVCAAGKPAYVEKPMARTHGECRSMIDAFTAAEIPLFIAYYRRALDRFINTKKLLAEGRLGTVTGIAYHYEVPAPRDLDARRLPWRFQAEQAGGGLLLDVGCHTLDILDFMLGPLVDVEGTAENRGSPYEVEDTVAMRFTTESGIPGTADWNFRGDTPRDRLVIAGTEGSLTLSTFGSDPVELATSASVERFDWPNPPHIQQPLIQTIVDELGGKGHCPSTAVSAARTSAVIDRVLLGYYGARDAAVFAHPERWPGRNRSPLP